MTCTTSFSWVVPGTIAVGDRIAGSQLSDLKRKGVDGIIVCRPRLTCKIEDYKKFGLDVLHVPIHDLPSENIKEWFDETYDFIRNHNTVYVHCAAGMSRSVSIVVAYLMKRYNWSLKDALEFLRSKRPCENINDGFRRQLKAYEKSLNG